jgi:hypothetical protein
MNTDRCTCGPALAVCCMLRSTAQHLYISYRSSAGWAGVLFGVGWPAAGVCKGHDLTGVQYVSLPVSCGTP